MARRIPKFPLKMANGANVRTIEDLRANADIDSIITYFFSGQLETWCRAFGYDTFPEKFENVSADTIRSIYHILEIPVNDTNVRNYVKTHGIHPDTTAIVSSAEMDEIEDNETIKRKLKAYVDSNLSLSDYAVEVLPVNDTKGKLCKYKINIANTKTEQYASFVLPYDVGSGYTKEMFEDDLYKKIAYTIKRQNEELCYQKLKNSRYAGLQVGDIFEFGKYGGKPIRWRVIDNNGEKLFCISEKVLCDKKIEDQGDGNNNWEECSLRRWLNHEFYNASFTNVERQLIVKNSYTHFYTNVNKELSDFIYILSMEEIEQYFDKHSRITDNEYWTRTARNAGGSHYMECVTNKGGMILRQAWRSYRNDASGPPVPSGVRPVFMLKY